MPKNPVSAEDRALFEGLIEVWQQKLGLMDWRFHLSSRPAGKDCFADISLELEQRSALVSMGRHFGDEAVTPDSLNRTACHELAHAWLYEFKCACLQAKDPYDSTVMSHEHRLINVLESLLCKPKDDE